MFPYKKAIIYQKQPQNYAQHVVFKSFKNKVSSDSIFSVWPFSDGYVFPISGFVSTQSTGISGTQNQIEIQEHETRSESVALWCAVRATGVTRLCTLHNETIGGVDFHKMLESYVGSEAHYSHRILYFKRMDHLSQYTCNLFSFG